MTLAQRYNAEVARLLPQHAADLTVDPEITSASAIDDIVFRRSEYLGGMAGAILAMIQAGAVRQVRTRLCLPSAAGRQFAQRPRHSARAAARLVLK